MKILLIDPPGTIKGINSGLGYIAGSLLKEGYHVKVLDFNNYPHEQDERLKEELTEDYPIGLSLKANIVISSLSFVNIFDFAIRSKAVDGLFYRLNGIRTNCFIWNYNLDALPFPDYSVFEKPVLRDYPYFLVTKRLLSMEKS